MGRLDKEGRKYGGEKQQQFGRKQKMRSKKEKSRTRNSMGKSGGEEKRIVQG